MRLYALAITILEFASESRLIFMRLCLILKINSAHRYCDVAHCSEIARGLCGAHTKTVSMHLHADGWSNYRLATVVFEPIVAFSNAVKGIRRTDILFDNQPLDTSLVSGGEDGGDVEGAMTYFGKGA